MDSASLVSPRVPRLQLDVPLPQHRHGAAFASSCEGQTKQLQNPMGSLNAFIADTGSLRGSRRRDSPPSAARRRREAETLRASNAATSRRCVENAFGFSLGQRTARRPMDSPVERTRRLLTSLWPRWRVARSEGGIRSEGFSLKVEGTDGSVEGPIRDLGEEGQGAAQPLSSTSELRLLRARRLLDAAVPFCGECKCETQSAAKSFGRLSEEVLMLPVRASDGVCLRFLIETLKKQKKKPLLAEPETDALQAADSGEFDRLCLAVAQEEQNVGAASEGEEVPQRRDLVFIECSLPDFEEIKRRACARRRDSRRTSLSDLEGEDSGVRWLVPQGPSSEEPYGAADP